MLSRERRVRRCQSATQRGRCNGPQRYIWPQVSGLDLKKQSRDVGSTYIPKVQMITKVKKSRPRSPKRKASKKTTSTKKTKKTNEKSLYGDDHHLMDTMTSPETEPGQNSLDSSSISTSDQESQ
ncbi:hypothetical protein STEG23_025825 [Scotinomys teguina]